MSDSSVMHYLSCKVVFFSSQSKLLLTLNLRVSIRVKIRVRFGVWVMVISIFKVTLRFPLSVEHYFQYLNE